MTASWPPPGAPDWLDVLPLPSALLDGQGTVVAANQLFVLTTGFETGRLDQWLPISERGPLLAALTLLHVAPWRVESRILSIDTTEGRRRFKAMLRSVDRLATTGDLQFVAQFLKIDADLVGHAGSLDENNWWSSALAGLEIGGWEVDFGTNAFVCSDAWKKMRGISLSDPATQSVEEVLRHVHNDDRSRIRAEIERQKLGEDARAQYEYRYRHADKSWIWIETHWVCVAWQANGRPARIIGIDFNITDRKKNEVEISHMSRRLRVALDVSRIGVFEADIDAGTVDWDEGMFRVYGIPDNTEVLIGGVWENMLHPDDRDRVLSRLEIHIEHLIPFSDEFRVQLKDNTERYIRSRTIPFIDQDGHRRMIGANWDVTDDIDLRRDLERANQLAEARNLELEEAKAAIERVALLDPLTKLSNRRDLDSRLTNLALASGHQNVPLSILHIDLDHFKQINDRFGHRTGDKVLQRVAEILSGSISGDDFAARIGGDEFLLVVHQDAAEALKLLADHIIDEIRTPIAIDGNECSFGASIGIATRQGNSLDLDQLLLDADIALYDAKKNGRSRSEFFAKKASSRDPR